VPVPIRDAEAGVKLFANQLPVAHRLDGAPCGPSRRANCAMLSVSGQIEKVT
jgi:hypothetical protein